MESNGSSTDLSMSNVLPRRQIAVIVPKGMVCKSGVSVATGAHIIKEATFMPLPILAHFRQSRKKIWSLRNFQVEEKKGIQPQGVKE